MTRRHGEAEVSVFSRLFPDLQERLDLAEPSGEAVEVPPVSPRGRAATLLRRAQSALRNLVIPPEGGPSRQEAEALARRYLEAGRRQWESRHWGSASLFAELALEWAARATEGGPTVRKKSQRAEGWWCGISPRGARDARNNQADHPRPSRPPGSTCPVYSLTGGTIRRDVRPVRASDAVIRSPQAMAPVASSERWLSGSSEAHTALEAAEAAGDTVRRWEARFPRQAMPILLRAEGFLVAARSSALAGRWRAATVFSRIAGEEFRAIRMHAWSAVSPRSVRLRPPREIAVIPLPPEGPL